MERPESATKVPEAGSRISPARYCTSTRRPRKAEYRAILYLVSESAGNKVNSTEGPPTEGCGKWECRATLKKRRNKNSLRRGWRIEENIAYQEKISGAKA